MLAAVMNFVPYLGAAIVIARLFGSVSLRFPRSGFFFHAVIAPSALSAAQHGRGKSSRRPSSVTVHDPIHSSSLSIACGTDVGTGWRVPGACPFFLCAGWCVASAFIDRQPRNAGLHTNCCGWPSDLIAACSRWVRINLASDSEAIPARRRTKPACAPQEACRRGNHARVTRSAMPICSVLDSPRCCNRRSQTRRSPTAAHIARSAAPPRPIREG